MNSLVKIFAAGFAAIGLAGAAPAFAMPVQLEDVATKIGPSVGNDDAATVSALVGMDVDFLAKIECASQIDGNQCNVADQVEEDGLLDAGLFSLDTADDFDGTVSFDISGSGFLVNAIVFKAGTSFTTYLFDTPTASGEFIFSLTDAMLDNALSHVSFYGSEIPIPGAFWLLGAGLAGLRFASRKRAA